MAKDLYRMGSQKLKVPDRDPRRVFWDDKDCERLTRHEYNAVKALLIVKCFLADARSDLRRRLESIPYGNQRMNMVFGGMNALLDDVLGTATVAQCEQLRNTMLDFEVRLMPVRTPMCRDVLMDLDVAKGLMDVAKEKCAGCTEDNESCRKCKLYQIMEATTPLEDYNNGLLCPYNLATWEE